MLASLVVLFFHRFLATGTSMLYIIFDRRLLPLDYRMATFDEFVNTILYIGISHEFHYESKDGPDGKKHNVLVTVNGVPQPYTNRLHRPLEHMHNAAAHLLAKVSLFDYNQFIF